jgi:DNA-binding XRE family transcriptional regulator
VSIDDDLDNLTQKVIDRLKELGPTEAAKQVGVSKGYICHITTGKKRPGFKSTMELAKKLGFVSEKGSKK